MERKNIYILAFALLRHRRPVSPHWRHPVDGAIVGKDTVFLVDIGGGKGHEMHVHEMHGCERHGYEMHVHGMHAYERHDRERHAYERHAYERHAVR
jgi:hypothetical protein